jgi:protein ImuB
MRIPSYDDLTPSIPDVSASDVFESVQRLLPDSGPVARGIAPSAGVPGQSLFACLRSTRASEALMDIARDFSPRIQRYGSACVVLDVSGLGCLLGDADAIGAELARAAADKCGGPRTAECGEGTVARIRPRFTSRYGIRIEPHPVEHANLSLHAAVDQKEIREEPSPVNTSAVVVAIAPTQISALLASFGGSPHTVISGHIDEALADLSLRALQQLMATIHGVTVLRPNASSIKPASEVRGLPFDGLRAGPFDGLRAGPAWAACEEIFDVLQRWGLKTLGEFAALPAADLSARLGKAGVALQRLARGIDPRPLVPDPDVPRYREQLELEWPIDSLEPLSFVLARLLDPLSLALERADRGAAAITLDLRLVDRSTHSRMLQLPVAMRDARVLRTLLLLDLESHPPGAAIDIVTIEIDPAPGRVLQYSLLERALPSAETIATLTARLSALVGESRCGMPVLLDSYRPDAFALERFAPAEIPARSGRAQPGAVRPVPQGSRTPICLRRFRPPIAVRVDVTRGRPVQVAIDRRGMPGGQIIQAAGPWRSSGEWWAGATRHWDRDEWDVSFSDGASCRLFRERENGRWFIEGVLD